jgi:iron complex outermembrane receptor protein
MINRKTAFCGASAFAMMIAGTAAAQVQPQPQPAVPAASPSASVTADGTSPAADTGAAQISSAGPAPSETADADIVVTGSRIPANGFGAPTPVTVASATQRCRPRSAKR